MEFKKEELESFASNLVIRFCEASPNKYKQIRIKVKEIINDSWNEIEKDYKRPLGQRKDDKDDREKKELKEILIEKIYERKSQNPKQIWFKIPENLRPLTKKFYLIRFYELEIGD